MPELAADCVARAATRPASTAPTCTASRWAGWSPRSSRCASPSACADSSWAPPRRAGRGARPALASSARRRGRGAARPAALARRWLFSPEFRREHPERVRSCCATSPPPRPAARYRVALVGDASTTTPSRGSARIQAPTLVMHGGADAHVAVANARLLAARIPDAELEIVAGAGPRLPARAPGERERGRATGSTAAADRARAARGRGVAARAEPLTRALRAADRGGADGREPRRARRGASGWRSAHVAADR